MFRSYCCPQCGNENIYSLSSIYKAGQSRVEVSGLTYNGGVGFFSGSGVQSSHLSQRCAPPSKPRLWQYVFLWLLFWWGGGLAIRVVFTFIVALITIPLVWTTYITQRLFNFDLFAAISPLLEVVTWGIEGILNIYTVTKPYIFPVFLGYLCWLWFSHSRHWGTSYRQWSNSYICLRCNLIF